MHANRLRPKQPSSLKTLVTLLFCLQCGTAQDTAGVGAITGLVEDPGGLPAAKVEACLAKTKRCAQTGSDGMFRLGDLRPGKYQVEVKVPGRGAMLTADVEVRSGLESTVKVTLPQLEAGTQSVTVSEPVFLSPEEIKTSGYLIQSREIAQSAGALQDVSRYVQVLPGVAIGTNDFRNDIIVRGGSPLENLFVVDNIEVPNINSFANFASAGGTVGILDIGLVQDVTFLTGGYPAPYTNRTSSVLQIAQREGNREQFSGRLTLGFAGLGGILEGPIRKDKGSWIVSARRSILDVFTKDIGFGGVPVTYTFNAKGLYDFTPRDRVWVTSLSAVDNIRLGAKQGSTNTDEVTNDDIHYSGWRNATGVNWQRLFGANGVGLLGVSHSESHVDNVVKDLLLNGIPAAGAPVDTIIANSPIVFSENSREGETTLKYDLTTYMSALGRLQIGASEKFFNIQYNTASPFGDDSPYALAKGLNPFALHRDVNTTQPAAYIQATRNFGKRLNLTYGGRFDDYRFLKQSRFSPRAGLSFRISDRLVWKASYGSYYQQPFFLFLAAFPINQGAVPLRADHYVTGLTYSVSNTLRVSAEIYRKNYKDYPVALQFPSLSLANLGDTFNVRDILFPLTSAGRGRAQGLELLVEKKFSNRWYGQANLSFASDRQAGLDGIKRPSSFDYPRIFNLTGGYHINAKWELATRISYLSGRPYTPFNASLSTDQSRGIFDLSKVNSVRLPDYIRTDLRVDRVFHIRDKPVHLFAGAQNIFNHQNIAGYTWNRRLNRSQLDKQEGIFPLIGFDWRF